MAYFIPCLLDEASLTSLFVEPARQSTCSFIL